MSTATIRLIVQKELHHSLYTYLHIQGGSFLWICTDKGDHSYMF